VDDIAAWFQWLHRTSGIKLTIFYDGYDGSRFLEGFVTTLKLSAWCLVLSLLLGAFTAWLCGSRIAAVRRAANAFVQLFRNTPPLVQLYFFYFALGPLLPKAGGMPLLGSMGWAIVSLTLLEAAFAANGKDWTVMIRDAKGSKDGWYWAEVYTGMTPDATAAYQYPFAYPNGGFGQYCINCHGSASSIFSAR
jgi:His/Glu/Gln/Arg/opine family amino acid ABC transporter permease subunit